MTPSSSVLRPIHRALLQWYKTHGRSLPWRSTRDPYRILVSEVMLQQTQVSRVAVKYREFLRSFPTLRSLAKATPGQVVRTWQGMGYNRRALWLHRAARQIVENRNSKVPDSFEALVALPGVGPNTARGILCFAFGKHEPVHDVNVERVLGRLFPQRAKIVDLRTLASSVLPIGRAYHWNQALMDLGATICTADAPSCAECPLRRRCPSAGTSTQTKQVKKRPEPTYRGIPRRLHRGRLVRMLTDAPAFDLRVLTRRLMGSASDTDVAWVRRLLDTLHAEGLVRVGSRNGRRFVSLVH